MAKSVDVLMWKGKNFRVQTLDRELHTTNDCWGKDNYPFQWLSWLTGCPSEE